MALHRQASISALQKMLETRDLAIFSSGTLYGSKHKMLSRFAQLLTANNEGHVPCLRPRPPKTKQSRRTPSEIRGLICERWSWLYHLIQVVRKQGTNNAVEQNEQL